MRVRHIIGGVLCVGALVGGVMYATTPDARAEALSDEVTQALRADGVDARGAYCDNGGRCWVTLNNSSIVTVRVHLFEDGSWRFTEGSRP